MVRKLRGQEVAGTPAANARQEELLICDAAASDSWQRKCGSGVTPACDSSTLSQLGSATSSAGASSPDQSGSAVF